MKKAGVLTTGKDGTSSLLGKNSTKTLKPIISGPKTTSSTISTKSHFKPSYNVPRKGKSTSIGVLWIPSKNKTKYKEFNYNSHQNDRTRDRTPSMYGLMSGDSSNHQSFLDKSKEDNSLLVPEVKEPTSIAIIGAGAAGASELPSDVVTTGIGEKQELIKYDDECTKEAAGDAGDTKDIQKDDPQNDEKVSTYPPNCKDQEKDNVDSVFLRSPPPHKAQSTAESNADEEDCGIKCLYYTLQCCDCVLM